MAARRGRSNCVIYETLFSTTIIPTTINKDLLVHDVSSEAEATRVCSSQARWRLVLFLTNMTMSIRPGQYPTEIETGQPRSVFCSSVKLFDFYGQVGPLIYCCWHSCELRLITKTIKYEMCNFMLQTMYYARCARGCNSSPEASIHQSTLETHMITQSCSSIFLCCRDQFLAKNSVNRDDYLQLQRAENLAAFDLILKNVCKYCGIVTILFFSFWLLCYCQFLTWN